MGKKGGRVFRNNYKAQMDKTRVVESGKGGEDGWGGEWG